MKYAHEQSKLRTVLRRLHVLVLLAILAGCSQKHDAPPKGYYLERDQDGYYRPCKESHGGPLFSLNDHMSKQEAIDRAWSQWEYDKKCDLREWARE